MKSEGSQSGHDMTSRHAGVVLAGGYSTRFGAVDKAFVELNGVPLLAHVASRLGRAVNGLIVSCRAEQIPEIRRTLRDRNDICVVQDPVPDQGPTAGLAASLQACRSEYTAVVACDNPFVDPDLITTLFEHASEESGAVPRVDGHLRPTQAVYRTEAMQRCCELALDKNGSLTVAINRLDPIVVPEEILFQTTDSKSFLDINTPADLEQAVEVCGQ